MINTNLIRPYEKSLATSAVPIYAICAHEMDGAGQFKDNDGPPAIPADLVTLAAANNFSAGGGDILSGSSAVLLGLGDGTDPFLAAAGSERLPSGDYYFAHLPAALDPTLICLGWLMGSYRFDRYRKRKHATANLVAPQNTDVDAVKSAADAMGLVRDLVNTPAADMLPSNLEEATRALGAKHNASVEVIADEELLTRNFPMIHAVGRASPDAPRLLDLKWQSPSTPADAPSIVLVGKGVCFDSGGLNIKGASGMALMKKDMGGAAHALGLASMIMAAKLPIRLRVLIGAVENAIDGSAFRPSDILSSRKGLSVEIGNTDAEGRLVLGDALTYGAEEKPDLMISLATLTGAARVALGPEVIPYYCTDDALSDAMARASETQFDPAWPMPLWQRYQSMLSSSVADMNNISGNSFAGSIIAALFLQRFIPAEQNWMHFDLYAWRTISEPGRPKGGEAQCIRALFSMIQTQYCK